jgi:hypothetical protein
MEIDFLRRRLQVIFIPVHQYPYINLHVKQTQSRETLLVSTHLQGRGVLAKHLRRGAHNSS